MDTMESTALAIADLGCNQPECPKTGFSEQTESKAGNVQNFELPPEKINWVYTITELTHHLATLYVLKFVLEGRIGLANIGVCRFFNRLFSLPCNFYNFYALVLDVQAFLLWTLESSGQPLGLTDFGHTGATKPKGLCDTFSPFARSLVFR